MSSDRISVDPNPNIHRAEITNHSVNDLDVLVLCDWLKLNKSCDKLDLSGNLLAANAVRALGFMLHVNTALTELDLRRNPCCKADWSLGPPQLEALYLSYSVMAAGLDLNRTLRTLYVRSVPIPCHLLREPGAVVDLSAAYCASQRRPPISVRVPFLPAAL